MLKFIHANMPDCPRLGPSRRAAFLLDESAQLKIMSEIEAWKTHLDLMPRTKRAKVTLASLDAKLDTITTLLETLARNLQ